MPREYIGRGDPRRSFELLWGTRARPSRGPKPALSVERIVQVAIEIADAEGLAALSMRRVAEQLGVGTMSLYRYVPNKAELLDLMLDTVTAEVPPADDHPGGWRAKVEHSAREDWALYHRHPWVLEIAVVHPAVGPNTLGLFESNLRALSGMGLTEREQVGVVSVVDGYVRGLAQQSVDVQQVRRHTGVSDEQWWSDNLEMMAEFIDYSRYPELARVAEKGIFEGDEDHFFEFGLQRILDGIEAFIRPRAALPGQE